MGGTMSARLFDLTGSVAALAAVAAMSMSASGQGSGAAAPPLAITAYNAGTPIAYTGPRTAWGDPDLQGVWSSDHMSGVPLARPQQFGDRLYLNDEEFAARARQVEAGVDRAENEATSTFRGDFARRAFRRGPRCPAAARAVATASSVCVRSRPASFRISRGPRAAAGRIGGGSRTPPGRWGAPSGRPGPCRAARPRP